MKEKTLRIIIYIAGAVCLYAFIAVRSFPLMNAILAEKMDQETKDFSRYGELYYFSCIADFKVPFPHKYNKYRLSDQNPSLKEADILSYGDSFFDCSFQKNIPELLSDSLDQQVFIHVTRDPTRANPFCLLNENSYAYTKNSRIFIYESVERNIPERFNKLFDHFCTSNSISNRSIKDEIIGFIFKKNSENLYEVMLKHSYITSNIYTSISTLKFRTFGYISSHTREYTLNPEPWLFHEKEYGNEPGGFNYAYTNEEISTYADNILAMRNNLKQYYNLDLLFMPIPTKYTIYHPLVNKETYNNFLPRLYAELDKRGVDYIDLFTDYRQSTETLYHGTDTHWNDKGVEIALGKVLKSIQDTSCDQIGYLYKNNLTKNN